MDEAAAYRSHPTTKSIGRPYGRVFMNIDDTLRFHPNRVEEVVGSSILEEHFNYKLRAVAFTLGASQLTGALVIVAQLVDAVRNLYLIAHQTLAIWKEAFFNTHKLEAMACVRHNTIEDLKHNALRILIAMISMIPLVGLIGAGALLLLIDSESISQHAVTTEEQMTEALAHHLVGGLPLINGVFSRILYQLNGASLQEHLSNLGSLQQKQIEQYKRDVPVHTIQIPVERGDNKLHHISCVYIPRIGPEDSSAPTAILFHPSGMIGETMLGIRLVEGRAAHAHILVEPIQHLRKIGWNVLLPTIGGYPGSDEGLETNECTIIQDVDAVLKKLDQDNVKNILVNGYSLGSALSMQAAQISEKIQMVMLEKPFDNLVHASEISWDLMLQRIQAQVKDSKILSIFKFLFPPVVIRGLCRSILPIGRWVPGVKTKEGQQFTTDGYNNTKKVTSYAKHLCVLADVNDEMMSVSKKVPDQCNTPALEQFKYSGLIHRRNLAERIYVAHQQHPQVKDGSKVISQYLEVGGGHQNNSYCIKGDAVLAYATAFKAPLLNPANTSQTMRRLVTERLGITLEG